MSKFELKLPKMGESVAEATLTAWLKDIGDSVDFDEAIVEIATDKVDSEVPSEKKGILIEKCFEINDVIKVGETIAIIETEEEESDDTSSIESINIKENENHLSVEENISKEIDDNRIEDMPTEIPLVTKPKNVGFLSPLVRKIIKSEKKKSTFLTKTHFSEKSWTQGPKGPWAQGPTGTWNDLGDYSSTTCLHYQ